jgi:hypothetical protein
MTFRSALYAPARVAISLLGKSLNVLTARAGQSLFMATDFAHLTPLLLMWASVLLMALPRANKTTLESALVAVMVELTARPTASHDLVRHNVFGTPVSSEIALPAALHLPFLGNKCLRMTNKILLEPRTNLVKTHVLLFGILGQAVKERSTHLGIVCYDDVLGIWLYLQPSRRPITRLRL